MSSSLRVCLARVSEGGLEPPPPTRGLAPQASASAIPPLGLAGSRIAHTLRAHPTGPPSGRKIRVTSQGAAEDEVVELTSELIRIDTTNTGDLETTTGEREAAEYVAGEPTEVGYEVEVLDSGAPGRSNVICRLAGGGS